MGGPIVRSGATPEFSAGWDRIFGGKKKPAAAVVQKTAKKTSKKPAKKK
jgi:hypothetical protein